MDTQAKEPLPAIDWNKQGEILDEAERLGLGKGARERAAGNPAYLRRGDYPDRETYEAAYNKALAIYKKPVAPSDGERSGRERGKRNDESYLLPYYSRRI